MKKVLFVATVVKLHINVFHTPYLKWFKENGYEVHVAAKNDYENKEDCYIPYCDHFYDIPFGRSPLTISNIKAAKELKHIIDTNDYEIIHCHTPVGGAIGRLAAIQARKNGTKVMYTAHGFHFYRGASLMNWLLFYPIERFLSRYTDTLITINKEDYKRAKQFKAVETVYVPGVGIDTKKIKRLQVNRDQKRKELNIPTDSFLLLSVGELSERKNHEIAIRALARANNKKIHFAICGEGPLREKLERLSRELGIEQQVHFLGFRRDISEIGLISDLFIFPSYQEGLPVALMEAMAVCLPIVASEIRGNSDLVSEQGGYLLPPEDVQSFARVIEKMFNTPKSVRDAMGAYNCNEIKKYDIVNVINSMEKIY